MSSFKKVEANRRNARRSTGPKSAAGRMRTSLNALKHGVTARTVLLPFEDRKAYERAAHLIVEQYRPVGGIEECLVELIIAARWRLVRFGRIEDEFVVSALGQRFGRATTRPPEAEPDQAQIQLRQIFGDDFARPQAGGDAPATDSLSPDGRTQSTHDAGKPSKTRSAPQALRRIRDCLEDQDALLNAYVPPATSAPMHEIARQRRQATRELLRNVAALETIQGRRKSIVAEYTSRDAAAQKAIATRPHQT